MEESTQDSVSTSVTPVSASISDKTQKAVLAWIFAPFTSYLWKTETDPFVRNHVRESFYLGIANLGAFAVMLVLSWVFNLFFFNLFWGGFGLATILSCGWSLLWLAFGLLFFVPRVVGVVKALNKETWEVPYVTKLLSDTIKF